MLSKLCQGSHLTQLEIRFTTEHSYYRKLKWKADMDSFAKIAALQVFLNYASFNPLFRMSRTRPSRIGSPSIQSGLCSYSPYIVCRPPDGSSYSTISFPPVQGAWFLTENKASFGRNTCKARRSTWKKKASCHNLVPMKVHCIAMFSLCVEVKKTAITLNGEVLLMMRASLNQT